MATTTTIPRSAQHSGSATSMINGSATGAASSNVIVSSNASTHGSYFTEILPRGSLERGRIVSVEQEEENNNEVEPRVVAHPRYDAITGLPLMNHNGPPASSSFQEEQHQAVARATAAASCAPRSNSFIWQTLQHNASANATPAVIVPSIASQLQPYSTQQDHSVVASTTAAIVTPTIAPDQRSERLIKSFMDVHKKQHQQHGQYHNHNGNMEMHGHDATRAATTFPLPPPCLFVGDKARNEECAAKYEEKVSEQQRQGSPFESGTMMVHHHGYGHSQPSYGSTKCSAAPAPSAPMVTALAANISADFQSGNGSKGGGTKRKNSSSPAQGRRTSQNSPSLIAPYTKKTRTLVPLAVRGGIVPSPTPTTSTILSNTSAVVAANTGDVHNTGYSAADGATHTYVRDGRNCANLLTSSDSASVAADASTSSFPATATSSQSSRRLNKFVRRLHEMLMKEHLNGVVDWRKGLLVLKDTSTFAKVVMPKYFNTRNFKTFRRQLNYYGFVHVRSFVVDNSATANNNKQNSSLVSPSKTNNEDTIHTTSSPATSNSSMMIDHTTTALEEDQGTEDDDINTSQLTNNARNNKTGTTTTALWVNQELAKYGTDDISSILMLRRVSGGCPAVAAPPPPSSSTTHPPVTAQMQATSVAPTAAVRATSSSTLHPCGDVSCASNSGMAYYGNNVYHHPAQVAVIPAAGSEVAASTSISGPVKSVTAERRLRKQEAYDQVLTQWTSVNSNKNKNDIPSGDAASAAAVVNGAGLSQHQPQHHSASQSCSTLSQDNTSSIAALPACPPKHTLVVSPQHYVANPNNKTMQHPIASNKQSSNAAAAPAPSSTLSHFGVAPGTNYTPTIVPSSSSTEAAGVTSCSTTLGSSTSFGPPQTLEQQRAYSPRSQGNAVPVPYVPQPSSSAGGGGMIMIPVIAIPNTSSGGDSASAGNTVAPSITREGTSTHAGQSQPQPMYYWYVPYPTVAPTATPAIAPVPPPVGASSAAAAVIMCNDVSSASNRTEHHQPPPHQEQNEEKDTVRSSPVAVPYLQCGFDHKQSEPVHSHQGATSADAYMHHQYCSSTGAYQVTSSESVVATSTPDKNNKAEQTSSSWQDDGAAALLLLLSNSQPKEERQQHQKSHASPFASFSHQQIVHST